MKTWIFILLFLLGSSIMIFADELASTKEEKKFIEQVRVLEVQNLTRAEYAAIHIFAEMAVKNNLKPGAEKTKKSIDEAIRLALMIVFRLDEVRESTDIFF